MSQSAKCNSFFFENNALKMFPVVSEVEGGVSCLISYKTVHCGSEECPYIYTANVCIVCTI